MSNPNTKHHKCVMFTHCERFRYAEFNLHHINEQTHEICALCKNLPLSTLWNIGFQYEYNVPYPWPRDPQDQVIKVAVGEYFSELAFKKLTAPGAEKPCMTKVKEHYDTNSRHFQGLADWLRKFYRSSPEPCRGVTGPTEMCTLCYEHLQTVNPEALAAQFPGYGAKWGWTCVTQSPLWTKKRIPEDPDAG